MADSTAVEARTEGTKPKEVPDAPGTHKHAPVAIQAAPEKGRPGRRKGTRKTGGRKKGVPNKISRDVKETILKRGKPLELLCDVARGVKIRVGPQAGPEKPEYQYPSLQERIAAAKTLLSKIVPDLKSQELSGPDGTPLQFQRNPDEVSDTEIARRIVWILTQAAPRNKTPHTTMLPSEPPREAIEACETPTDTTGQGDNSNGHSAGLKNLLGHENKSEIDLGDQPPKIGFTRVFNHSDYSIRCDAGSRPGLPPIFTLIRRGDGILRIGAWIDVLSMLRRLTGEELAPFEDAVTVDTIEGGPRPDERAILPVEKPVAMTTSQRRRRRR